LATDAVGGGSRQRRVGEGQLGGGPDSVNAFLQFYFGFFANPRKSLGLGLIDVSVNLGGLIRFFLVNFLIKAFSFRSLIFLSLFFHRLELFRSQRSAVV
jgi:hypothetical protein